MYVTCKKVSAGIYEKDTFTKTRQMNRRSVIKGGQGWKNIQQQVKEKGLKPRLKTCDHAALCFTFLHLSRSLSRFTRRVTGSSLTQFRPHVVLESSIFLFAVQEGLEIFQSYDHSSAHIHVHRTFPRQRNGVSSVFRAKQFFRPFTHNSIVNAMNNWILYSQLDLQSKFS